MKKPLTERRLGTFSNIGQGIMTNPKDTNIGENSQQKIDFPDLHPNDLSQLRESGLTDETIAKRGYTSSDDSSDDKDALQKAGYKPIQQRAGLFIPFRHWNSDGELSEIINYSQLRPHNPRIDPKNSDKVFKYESPIGRPLEVDMLHCPPDLQANETVYIAEGIKKADAVAQASGGYVVGIVGCWGWRKQDGEVRHQIAELLKKNREVVLILDADVGSNNQVRWAAKAFIKACEKEKATPKVLNLAAVASGTEGIDDYIAQIHKEAGDDCIGAVYRAFKNIPEFTPGELENELGVVSEITFDSIQECLKDLGLAFRMEVRGGGEQVRYTGKDTGDLRERWGEWSAFARADVCSMSKLLQNGFRVLTGEGTSKPLTIGRDKLRDMIHAFCNDNQVDGFIEYLEGLPIWDTKPRIDTVLQDMFGAEDNPLTRWANQHKFVGTVRRTFEPGCLFRTIPTLKGDEDIGKSDLLRQMLPYHLQYKGFSDQLKLDDNAQRQCEQLTGAIIVELAELVGMRKADINALKAFITRRTDKIRKAYGDQPTEERRRFILVGTTNDEQPLPNVEGGNTRFVVVPLTKGCDVKKYLDPIRDQLWAEALHRYRQGETGEFPRELRPVQRKENENYRSRNEVLEDAVALFKERKIQLATEKDRAANRLGPFKIQEVLEHSDLPTLNQSTQNQLAPIMREQGFERKYGKRNGWWLEDFC